MSKYIMPHIVEDSEQSKNRMPMFNLSRHETGTQIKLLLETAGISYTEWSSFKAAEPTLEDLNSPPYQEAIHLSRNEFKTLTALAYGKIPSGSPTPFAEDFVEIVHAYLSKLPRTAEIEEALMKWGRKNRYQANSNHNNRPSTTEKAIKETTQNLNLTSSSLEELVVKINDLTRFQTNVMTSDDNWFGREVGRRKELIAKELRKLSKEERMEVSNSVPEPGKTVIKEALK